ncbi:MAG TPA: AraC family transcriptional regulator [Polyangiaceae bacterium]
MGIHHSSMQPPGALGLNVSGDGEVTRIIRRGALHYSRGQRTSMHAEYAWKIHIGIDAPVWLQSPNLVVDATAGARVLVTPPGSVHGTGAVGWSCAIFVAPGALSTPRRPTMGAFAISGALGDRIVEACRQFEPTARRDTGAFTAELMSLIGPRLAPSPPTDARVEGAIRSIECRPNLPLVDLARAQWLSLDRLSRLVTVHTGMRLRQHVLWSRLLKLLSSKTAYTNLADAALGNGFSDHAHLTRTYRAYLGRTPSDFLRPPDVVEPWSF